MLYKKYPLYNELMEIMIPTTLELAQEPKKKNSNISRLGDFLFTQYTWLSKDRKVVVNITKGSPLVDETELIARLQDYYSVYKRDITKFECKNISLIDINGKKYGQMIYTSEMMGYIFYTVFVVGNFQNGELIVSLQCIETEIDTYEHVFSNIIDSLRICNK